MRSAPTARSSTVSAEFNAITSAFCSRSGLLAAELVRRREQIAVASQFSRDRPCRSCTIASTTSIRPRPTGSSTPRSARGEQLTRQQPRTRADGGLGRSDEPLVCVRGMGCELCGTGEQLGAGAQTAAAPARSAIPASSMATRVWPSARGCRVPCCEFPQTTCRGLVAQRGVHRAAIRVGRAVVDGGTDERMPEPHRVPDLDEAELLASADAASGRPERASRRRARRRRRPSTRPRRADPHPRRRRQCRDAGGVVLLEPTPERHRVRADQGRRQLSGPTAAHRGRAARADSPPCTRRRPR